MYIVIYPYGIEKGISIGHEVMSDNFSKRSGKLT